jgi:carbon-monoxide dehydrogenase medium subunit
MFPTSFAFHRATSLADAQALLAKHPHAKLLAGGHSLLPLMKLRLASPDTLIDIGRVPELKGVTIAGDRIRIGALTTHAALASSDALRGKCAVVAETAAHIGDPAVRNRGTIGGSIAHADPGADLPTVLVALDAQIEIAGAQGTRTEPASTFFAGLMTTTLGPAEIVTAVSVPVLAKGEGAAYAKMPHPASRYAVIGAAALVATSGGRITSSRIAVGGLVSRPTRLEPVEAALHGQAASEETVGSAASRTSTALGDDALGDVFASADYRRAVAGVYVGRAITAALAGAR